MYFYSNQSYFILKILGINVSKKIYKSLNQHFQKKKKKKSPFDLL